MVGLRMRIGLIATGALLLVATDAPTVPASDATPADTPVAAMPLEYPPALRDRVVQTRGRPELEPNAHGTVTWLHDGFGALVVWDWKSQPEDAPEWQRLPTLAETVTLDPDVEYTYDNVWLDECDALSVAYPFKADRALLLRVRRGDTVIFDALQEAMRRSGKSLDQIVFVSAPPTPAVAATVAAPGADSALGAALQRLLDAEALGEEALRAQWRTDRESLGAVADAGAAPLILLEQPPAESRVVVLIHDPKARGRESVQATALEADCPDRYLEPGRTMRLDAVEKGAPLFAGTANTEGVHGTLVKIRYRGAGDGPQPIYESAPIGIYFH